MSAAGLRSAELTAEHPGITFAFAGGWENPAASAIAALRRG
ncbi:hypothetical protein [Desulforhopalus vacuolatus]|nr:hypothetical protein [Desulforhopalus vacuolatus]